jgi:superfamily II DNA/RNA helicase
MEEIKPLWENFELIPLRNLKENIKAYNFQQYATYLSLNQSKFILGLQTGLGKTLCAYMSYYYYKLRYPNTKLLVVSNKSALLQLEEQLHKFFHVEEKIFAIHDTMFCGGEKYRDARNKIISSWGKIGEGSIDIIWIGYPIFRIDNEGILNAILKIKKEKYNVFVIFDEANFFMNMRTQTFKAIQKVSRMADKLLVLTATLSKGKLEQIYCVFKGMDLKLFTTKKDFFEEYCIVWQHPKIWYLNKILGYKNIPNIIKKIEPYTVVLRKIDVAKQLPKFTIKKTYLDHSREQLKFISDIYSGEINILDFVNETSEISEKLVEVVETNFIKMALLDERIVSQIDLKNYKIYSPKTEEIIRILEEDFVDEKVVIYTHSRRYLELLVKSIAKYKSLPDRYKKILMIHGGVNMVTREKNKKLFSESEDYNIMIINDAGIESINLQAANTIIISTLPFTFGALTQLAGRISRIDTKHSNLYLNYLLMENSQDEDEYKIIMQQGVLMKNILGEAEEGIIDYSVLIEGGDTEISRMEYQNKSLVQLLLCSRKRRARFYHELNKEE